MDITQLQYILDQITFAIDKAKNETTTMSSAAKYLAAQIQIIQNNKNIFITESNKNFEQMKNDILSLQNKINNRLAFADESHIQSLSQISDAAWETQKSIRDFGKLLKEEISENIIEIVISQIGEKFKNQEIALLEITKKSSQHINGLMIQIHTYMMKNEQIQKIIEENSKNTLNEVDQKLKEMRKEVQVTNKNIDLINQSTVKTLQVIERVQNAKLWGGKLSTWLIITSTAFLTGVIFTAIIAIWFNPIFKAFIAALLKQ